MDIWAWTYQKDEELRENGHSRLADIMRELPGHSCDDRHDRVDALYPEALALARQIKDSWCEIFIRHWHLQSQVLNRRNAKGMLHEAIDLLEFSHKEENAQCPQRVCTVQDLANCYGIQDGPGFANERIEVAEETLASINGSWPCYECVSSELLDALIDNQKIDEALARYEKIEEEVHAHNERISGDLALTHAEIYNFKGEHKKALELLKKTVNGGGGERFEKKKRLRLAKTYCLLKDFDSGKRKCPRYDEILISAAYYEDWAEIQYYFAAAECIDVDETLVLQIDQLAFKQEESGAIRSAVTILQHLIAIALKKGYTFAAQSAQIRISKLIPQLNKDLGATDKLDSLKAAIIAAQKNVQQAFSFSTVDEFLQHEFGSHSQFAAVLLNVFDDFPQNPLLAIEMALCYQQFHLLEEAEHCLEEARAAFPNHAELEFFYANIYAQKHGIEKYLEDFSIDLEIENQTEKVDTEEASAAQDLLASRLRVALQAFHPHTPDKAKIYGEALLRLGESSSKLLYVMFELYRDTNAYSQAHTMLDHLIEKHPDDKALFWDKAVLSSLEQEWPAVHRYAEKLALNIDPQQPINQQNFGIIRIAFPLEDGGSFQLNARRTGPVTAKIIGVAKEEFPVYYNNVVVFDPAPLNQLDQQDEEGHACDSEGYYTQLFPVVGTIEKHAYSLFPMDGVHPGTDALDALTDKLDSLNITFSIRNSSDYEVWFEDENSEGWLSRPGVYLYLIVPEQQDLLQLHETLKIFSDQQEHPLVWPKLVEEIGNLEELKRQLEISEKYEL